MSNWGQQLTAPLGWDSDPIWLDEFLGDELDTTKWNRGICSRASNGALWNAEHVPNLCSANSAPGGNNAEYFAPRQLNVNNGLTISAEPWSLVEGYSYVSGCISSYGHFALKSGIVRVRARMPDTTLGAWPAIWFLPGPTRVEDSDVGEVDVHEGGMLGRVSGVPINQVVASTFHRPDLDGYQLGFGYNAGVALNSTFHDFDLELSVGMVRALFDDEPIATWTKNLTGDPLQIIIGLSVASDAAEEWHTTGTPSLPCAL